MLVSALAPLLTAGCAAAFVLPESLRLNKIDIDSFYPESLKDVASAVENVEHIVDALTHQFTPEPEDKTVYELIAANPESVLRVSNRVHITYCMLDSGSQNSSRSSTLPASRLLTC